MLDEQRQHLRNYFELMARIPNTTTNWSGTRSSSRCLAPDGMCGQCPARHSAGGTTNESQQTAVPHIAAARCLIAGCRTERLSRLVTPPAQKLVMLSPAISTGV